MRRRGSKYGAVPTMVDGVRFASKAEARRYAELKLLVAAGRIKSLELQPRHRLPCGVEYRGDFAYINGYGARVVEDVKGFETAVFLLKLRMLRGCPCQGAKLDITIIR